RIVDALKKTGQLDNTLVMFMSDNGACAEPIPDNVTMDSLVNDLKIARATTRDGDAVIVGNRPEVTPGGEHTYQSYGIAWANLSNTPFRLYKHWTHEGGVASPLICHWPDGIDERGGIRHGAGQLPDIMATLVELAGAEYPSQYNGNDILPLEGASLLPVFAKDSSHERPLFWEHEGNAAIRVGKWKLVREYPNDWELYDMDADRTEVNNLAASEPERLKQYVLAYEQWAARSGVIDRRKIVEMMADKPKAFWDEAVEAAQGFGPAS
ncbi:MAG: sulfatase/phosphatase domain-containing protein, partial [Burkholderiaceae bacterium]